MHDPVSRLPPAPSSSEAAVVRLLNRRIASLYRKHLVNRPEYRWTIGVRTNARSISRWIEVILPVHSADPRIFRSDTASSRFCFPTNRVHLARASFVPLESEIEELGRYCARERLLVAAGLDPNRPPASTYDTDLITLRTFVAGGIDLDRLVADAPRAIRSRVRPGRGAGSASMWPLFGFHTIRAVRSSALPDDFYPFSASFRLGVLELGVLELAADVSVFRDDEGEAEAEVVIGDVWPESIILAAVGMKLYDLIAHPAFDDARIVVIAAAAVDEGTRLTVIDPRVPLASRGTP